MYVLECMGYDQLRSCPPDNQQKFYITLLKHVTVYGFASHGSKGYTESPSITVSRETLDT